MSPHGRTIWWAKDSGWWRRELIVELGEDFGADGPAVIDWLSCEAKAQNDGGSVKSGIKAAARGCFVAVERVREVLSRCVTLGLLDDFAETNGRFTCRISGWQADQDRGRAAARQAKRREEIGSTPPDEPLPPNGTTVTDRDTSRNVTPSSIQERRGEGTTTAQSAGVRPDNLVAQIATVQAVFTEFAPDGLVPDEISVANALARFPNADHVQLAHGCAELLRTEPSRDPGRCFHGFLEEDARRVARSTPRRALRAVPDKRPKRFESERTDFSHYDDLVNR